MLEAAKQIASIKTIYVTKKKCHSLYYKCDGNEIKRTIATCRKCVRNLSRFAKDRNDIQIVAPIDKGSLDSRIMQIALIIYEANFN